MKRLFTVVMLLLFVNLAWSSVSDTITYKRKRGSNIEKALIDVTSGAVRVIQSDHSHIHNYEAYGLNLIDTVAVGGSSVIAMNTGNKEVHLKYANVWAEKSPMRFSIYFNPDTIRMSSDTLVPYNKNQHDNVLNSTFPSVTTITDSVDTIAGHIDVFSTFFGGGNGVGGTSFAGTSSNDFEWIFPPNKYVVFSVSNLSGAASLTTMGIYWYEIK